MVVPPYRDQAIAKCPNQNNLPGDVRMYIPYSFKLITIMLMLDPTILFYWTLSDPPPKKIKSSTVETWAKSILSSAKPVTSQGIVKTGKSSTNCHSSTILALTSASSHVTSSVLTSDITIKTMSKSNKIWILFIYMMEVSWIMMKLLVLNTMQHTPLPSKARDG